MKKYAYKTLLHPFPNMLNPWTFRPEILIGIIYLWRIMYLSILKLLGQNVLEFSVAQGMQGQLDLWPTRLNINWEHLLMNDYLPNLKLLGQTILELHVSVAKRIEINSQYLWHWSLSYWPEYKKVSSTRQPTKFKAFCGTKRSWVITCTRWSRLGWPLT